MTNQNPAVPQPQSPKLNRDILTKVNAHADRSIDRLFADIDELLSGDLDPDDRSSPANLAHQTEYSTAQYPQLQQHPADPSPANFTPPQQLFPGGATPTVESDPPQNQKKGLPLWVKALLGIGATSIAAGGGLLWLMNERKIELPKNIDTSWLPFQSRSQVSPEDAKFAEYMRKSISKIESASPQSTSATNIPIPNPAAPIVAPTTPATPIITSPTTTGVIVTAPSPATPAAKASISLVKTRQNGDRPSAIFQIDGKSQTITVGQKIGSSNWSLLTVAKGEVIMKKKGGEIRSIYVGQKF